MRYACTKLPKGYSVIYDKTMQRTLLLEGDFDNEIINDYEKTASLAQKIPQKITTFVLNTTQTCNLRCKYCSRYHGDFSNEHMDFDTMRKVIEWVCEYSRKINEKCVVQFHGGEPVCRWKQIRDVLVNFDQDYLQKCLDFRIQTNGTIINEDFLNFCKEYDIHIGISIDGPPEVTDEMRRFVNGEGISNVLAKNIKSIRNKLDSNIVSCLCVVTQNSIDKADEVFDYITSNGIQDLSILPLYNDYSCISDDKSIIPQNKDMASFSKRIIDLWLDALEKNRTICIPNFQIWVWNLLSSNSDVVYTCSSCCGTGETIAFVDLNADLYPCGPLSYFRETRITNLFQLDLTGDINAITEQLQPLSKRVVAECQECGLQGICKSGCAANSYLHYRDLTKKDPYCEYWKDVISYLIEKIIDKPYLLELIPEYSLRV